MLDTTMHKTKNLLLVFLRWFHSPVSFAVWSNCISENRAIGPPREVSTLPCVLGRRQMNRLSLSHELLARYSQTILQLQTKATIIEQYETPLHSCPISAYIVFLAKNFQIPIDLLCWPRLWLLWRLFHHNTNFLQGTWWAEVWRKLPKPMRPMALNVRIVRMLRISSNAQKLAAT